MAGGAPPTPPGVPPIPRGRLAHDRVTLPKSPDYAICPVCGPETEPQDIRLVLDGMTGTMPTVMTAQSSGP